MLICPRFVLYTNKVLDKPAVRHETSDHYNWNLSINLDYDAVHKIKNTEPFKPVHMIIRYYLLRFPIHVYMYICLHIYAKIYVYVGVISLHNQTEVIAKPISHHSSISLIFLHC